MHHSFKCIIHSIIHFIYSEINKYTTLKHCIFRWSLFIMHAWYHHLSRRSKFCLAAILINTFKSLVRHLFRLHVDFKVLSHQLKYIFSEVIQDFTVSEIQWRCIYIKHMLLLLKPICWELDFLTAIMLSCLIFPIGHFSSGLFLAA